MSEGISTTQVSAKSYKRPAPGRIKFVGVMNIINAVLLFVLGLVGLAGESGGAFLLLILFGAVQGAMGYLLFRMNRIAWIINIALYGIIILFSVYVIAESIISGEYIGFSTRNIIMLIYFSIIEFCLVSAKGDFRKR